MGLYDRDYTQAEYDSHYGDSPRMRIALPRLTPAVKWLLIVNTSVFILSFLITPLAEFFFRWFSVYPATVGTSLQLWRLVTYQFLHDINVFRHIFINMLILYFFGTMLERHWGSRKFLTFYLICGAMGGLGGAYLPLVILHNFNENMTAGRGFIALCIVILGRWNPLGVFVGALLFAGVDAFQMQLQAAGSNIPYPLLLMLPYVITIIVLVGLGPLLKKVVAPKKLAVPYEKGEE